MKIRCKKCDYVGQLPAELPLIKTKENIYPFISLYLHMTKHGIHSTKLKKCFHEVEE